MQNFYQIIIGDFVNSSPSLFDVYLRDSESNYILIVRSGESFSFRIVSELSSKGYSFLYIRMEDKERYLSFCSQMAKRTLMRIFGSEKDNL